VREDELRIDVFRASGPGGQGVNTADSAVRITHIPTNIVVSCQNERSQLRNRDTAMRHSQGAALRDRREEAARGAGRADRQKKEIAFGSQIRSYTFHPYQLIKDHRTGSRWATSTASWTATSTRSSRRTCSGREAGA
jgi:peptide chain release factor 2